jgi:hypothetical protein
VSSNLPIFLDSGMIASSERLPHLEWAELSLVNGAPDEVVELLRDSVTD